MDREKLIVALHADRIYWLAVGAIILINGFVYWGLIRPQVAEIDQLQRAYTSSRRAGANIADTDDPIAAYLQAVEALEAFKERLPYRNSFADLVKEINEALDKNGLSAGRMTFKPKRNEQLALWQYTTKLTVRGSYARLKQLLADIQNSASLICIEELSMQADAKDPDATALSLKVSTYFN